MVELHSQRQHHHAYCSESYVWLLVDSLYTKCAEEAAQCVFREQTIVKVSWEHLPPDAIPTHVTYTNSPGF